MAGRNDATIAAALQAMAQAVGQQPNVGAGANGEVRMLETFLRNHPPTFLRLKEFSGSCNAVRFRWCALVRTC